MRLTISWQWRLWVNAEFAQQTAHQAIIKEFLETHPGWLDTKLFSKDSLQFILEGSEIRSQSCDQGTLGNSSWVAGYNVAFKELFEILPGWIWNLVSNQTQICN